MQKAKKYDWKDSNMALFGSETEKEVTYLYCSSSIFLLYDCWHVLIGP